MPSRAEKMIAFADLANHLLIQVLSQQIPMRKASEAITKLISEHVKPWWEVENRYPKWLKHPCTPDLVEDKVKNTPTDATLWNRDPWHEHALKCLQTEEQKVFLPPIVLQHLKDNKLLDKTPSLEALEFYKKDPDQCWQVWDRKGLWVFAWKDACINFSGKMYVPGMQFDPKTRKFKSKWVALQNIHKYKFKVLLRKENT